jgi:hypothetical protein
VSPVKYELGFISQKTTFFITYTRIREWAKRGYKFAIYREEWPQTTGAVEASVTSEKPVMFTLQACL